MEPQLVPIAPEIKSDIRKMLFARRFNAADGDARKAL